MGKAPDTASPGFAVLSRRREPQTRYLKARDPWKRTTEVGGQQKTTCPARVNVVAPVEGRPLYAAAACGRE